MDDGQDDDSTAVVEPVLNVCHRGACMVEASSNLKDAVSNASPEPGLYVSDDQVV